MKIRLVVVELFHAEERRDGRTERHEDASSHCSQFCHRAKKRTPYVRPCPPACVRLVSVSKEFERVFIKFGTRVLSKFVDQMQASLKMT
jgi:hypothetical protein